jgi:hypothetical protein
MSDFFKAAPEVLIKENKTPKYFVRWALSCKT